MPGDLQNVVYHSRARGPALVSALSLLTDGSETTRRLGKASRQRTRNEFSVGAMVEKSVAVYDWVIRGGQRLAPPPGAKGES